MTEGGVCAQLHGVPVGPELAAVLAGLGPVERRAVDADGVREVIPDATGQVLVAQAWQRVLAWAESQLNAAVLQIAGSRLGPEDEDWGREEIAAGLRWSNQATADRLEVARTLSGRCFLTGRALAEGQITYQHAAQLVRALEPLDDERAAQVEAGLLGAAGTLTAAQLARKARKAVAKADPAGADARHKKARAKRRVDFTPLADGMAELRAILPADQSARIRVVVQQAAGRTATGTDTRTLDQRQADALVALTELGWLTAEGTLAPAPDSFVPSEGAGGADPGADAAGAAVSTARAATAAVPSDVAARSAVGGDAAAGGAGPGGRAAGASAAAGTNGMAELIRAVLAGRRAAPARIALTAPLSTVLGASDLSGELTGYGPVPATIVRELAADSRWEKWITDPGGVVTDLGRTTYRPPAALAALVRATYPTCVFPGCSLPSYRCDLDHNVRRVDGGDTSTANLVPLCRRHHRAKDEAGWSLVHDPVTGACSWTSPAGHTYTVTPPDQSGEPEGPAEPAPVLDPQRAAVDGALVHAGAADPPPF